MLRLILRHTMNALLLACCLLLLCSFERLCRYDFGQIQLTAPTLLEEGLQVDHFVFWGGIPAWERSYETKNPVGVWLLKVMEWAGAPRLQQHPSPVVVPADEDVPFARATSLAEANVVIKRQIRHNKKNHRSSSSNSTTKEDIQELERRSESEHEEESRPAERALDQEISTATEATPITDSVDPKIGFVLHLPSCDREAIASWQKVWTEQALDQPFLFHVLLGGTADEACAAALQGELKGVGDDAIDYQVTRNNHMALALQTCRTENDLLQQLGLDELLYYDASKAVGRIRSSAMVRRFQLQQSSSSSFVCSGGQQKPAFCDDAVLDCSWFQYAPPPPPGTQEPKLWAAAA